MLLFDICPDNKVEKAVTLSAGVQEWEQRNGSEHGLWLDPHPAGNLPE